LTATSEFISIENKMRRRVTRAALLIFEEGRNYFLPEQPHESPHDDVESFRAGLKEAMRDHPRRAT